MYEAGVQSSPEPTQPVRPRKAKTLSILLIVFGVLGILVSFLLLSLVSDSAGHGQSVPSYMYLLVILQVLLSGAQVACGIAIWQGRAWARGVAIVLCSLNIIGALVSLFTGAVVQAIAGIAINVALIRMLNDYEVVTWCDR